MKWGEAERGEGTETGNWGSQTIDQCWQAWLNGYIVGVAETLK